MDGVVLILFAITLCFGFSQSKKIEQIFRKNINIYNIEFIVSES
jgi:hypothetical protein